MIYPYNEVETAIIGLRDAFKVAEQSGSWFWIADEFYHEDCVYICPYGGTLAVVANGREEIRRTHYGRDMEVGSGWNGWTFPIIDYAINGNHIISHWLNRGPGRRPDGGFYEQHGVSFITYGGGGKFSTQYDLFDLAHMMKLCDELEEVGLLSDRLKQEWVIPQKRKLISMLGRRV